VGWIRHHWCNPPPQKLPSFILSRLTPIEFEAIMSPGGPSGCITEPLTSSRGRPKRPTEGDDRMPGKSDEVPPGWYPAPHGGQRYWDGQRWLALPDPDGTTVAPAAASNGSADKPGGRTKVVVASVVALAVLAVAGIGALIWKNSHDTQMRNAAIAASSSKQAAADAEAKEADRVRQERAKRTQTVKDIEASVKKLAEKQAGEGLFDGPVLSVSCDPIGGGSTDDLTAKTTVFECFAATKDNGDGTLSGKKYHATMNWDTGDYTYGLGGPR